VKTVTPREDFSFAPVQFFMFDGDSFVVECSTGSDGRVNLFEVAKESGNRLARECHEEPHA
jgi:hypothetical protein